MTLTVKDSDGTVKANVFCYLSNTTKGSILENDTDGIKIKTDSNGLAILDAANFPVVGSKNEYDVGDVLLLIAYDGTGHDAVRYVITGDEKSQTLQLNIAAQHGGPNVTTTKIMSILGANTAGAVAFAKVYSVTDGELLCHLEVPASDSRDHIFGGGWGKGANGGFVIEREATTLVVTTTVR